MKIDNQIEIIEMATKWDRFLLSKRLNEIVEKKIGIKDFVNYENMVFNRLHLAVFIKLLEEKKEDEN